MAALVHLTKHLSKNDHISSHFQNLDKEELLLNIFYKASIALIPKPEENNSSKENYRPMSLMTIDAGILSKILAKQIQQLIKRITYGHEMDHLPWSGGKYSLFKDDSTYVNQQI